MATVNDIAKFFLTMSQPDEGDYLSNLKLQKLVYYAQGFHLALFDKPLFKAKIQAWEHGPVVESLYHEYKGFGSTGIPVPDDFDLDSLSKDQRKLLEEVWNVYGQFSAWKLRNMTHEEPPWSDTSKGAVISTEAMTEFFLTMVE